MDFQSYLDVFQEIITEKKPRVPYDQPMYMDYTKLNWSRSNRWLKKGVLFQDLVDFIKTLKEPMQWIVITEPWCGDAAHTVPFIHLLSQVNPLISVQYELRDSDPFRINQYLTKGSKSIPVLIVRNSKGEDLFVWGPRPETCQEIYQNLNDQNADFETIKLALQQWYNADKGISFQQELLTRLKVF